MMGLSTQGKKSSPTAHLEGRPTALGRTGPVTVPEIPAAIVACIARAHWPTSHAQKPAGRRHKRPRYFDIGSSSSLHLHPSEPASSRAAPDVAQETAAARRSGCLPCSLRRSSIARRDHPPRYEKHQEPRSSFCAHVSQVFDTSGCSSLPDGSDHRVSSRDGGNTHRSELAPQLHLHRPQQRSP